MKSRFQVEVHNTQAFILTRAFLVRCSWSCKSSLFHPFLLMLSRTLWNTLRAGCTCKAEIVLLRADLVTPIAFILFETPITEWLCSEEERYVVSSEQHFSHATCSASLPCSSTTK